MRVVTAEHKRKMLEGRQKARDAKLAGKQSKSDIPAALQGILGGIPDRYKARFAKAYSGDLGPTAVIRLKCAECCAYEDVSNGVRECTCRRCPLWAYRGKGEEAT